MDDEREQEENKENAMVKRRVCKGSKTKNYLSESSKWKNQL